MARFTGFLARQLCFERMMKVAIPQWQDRVSPVFDVAANLLLIDVVDNREIGRQEIALTPTTDPGRRAQQVANLQANTLICGAVSWPLEVALKAVGVRVISQICGQINEVIESFLAGNLGNDAFRMPGCCRRRRFRGGRESGCLREDEHAQAKVRGGRRMRRNRKEI